MHNKYVRAWDGIHKSLQNWQTYGDRIANNSHFLTSIKGLCIVFCLKWFLILVFRYNENIHFEFEYNFIFHLLVIEL